MDKQDIILRQYREIKSALNDKLILQGYAPVHELANDEVFGSRYMIWSNNMEAMRLTWDGKEQWFILEITEDLPLHALSRWDEIVVTPFNPGRHTAADGNAITDDFIKNLE
ncbi:hypothetical protein [Mucilaginibacter ginkgonis]|uniref:Uncharacterized protein n=1 Tax=Mucilaginibacter ginkgonis TaxID=2682091 RepID=A0A6I4INE7_9SPHI|nr:hypothetical protein [Mucilaginibacter ginkgonis]QQL49381.1 hypothetical protein GO620_014585 [Mucilaginibacter ginkgonis]